MKYLSLSQLREKLGDRGRSSILRDVEAGRLPPARRLGGKLYWVEDEVDAAMQELAVAPR